MNKIVALSIIGAFAFGNILTGNAKTYRAIQTNSEGRTITVTLSEGENDRITKPLKQFRFKYNTEGLLVEKIVHKWDSNKSKWTESIVYKYEYDNKDQLVELQYTKWDDEKLAWKNSELTLFSNIEDSKLLTINYLDTIK